ncbi:hypothetical protein L7F22_052472 [Adiantum nelumboides]|nr:hypothetical protein [Adiantum nelumboides]
MESLTPMVNYILEGEFPKEFTTGQRRKLIKQASTFLWLEGSLYQKGKDLVCRRVPSTNEIPKILKGLHEEACGGNFSHDLTLKKVLLAGYVWPSMHADVQHWCRSCHNCQVNGSKKLLYGPRQAVIANGPFEKWGIDAMGPLPRTANGKLYILVAIDYMTRWVEAQSIAKVNEKTVSKFVYTQICCRFGTPLEIVSDNGPGFRRGLLTEVCEELKISHRHSTPYYPQSNGLVEKANEIIAGIIRKMVESKPKRWDNFLDGAIWAYRTTYRDATQFTPFNLVYGQEALQPIELNIPTINLTSRQEQSIDEAWIDRLLNLVELEWKREAAYHCYKKKALQLKDKLNEGIKDKEIKEKSLVLRYNNALDNRFDAKFERRWEGPFIVKKAFTGGYYQLMDLNGKEHPRKVNGYRLKPYLSRILPAVFETKQVSKKTKKAVIANGPFEKWGIDAMGPLPRTANGKLYILVAIDYMTRFGTPLEIVSDNGPGFRRGLLTEVCEELKISHRHSTPYYPQPNGLVEKANGIIAGIIRKMVESRQEQSNDEAWIGRLLNLVELEWKREAAYHCYEKKALQLKDKLNEGIKDKEIKEKSLVLRYNNALDNRFDAKFERRWEGPFIVKKAFTGGYYQLMDLNGKEHPRKVNGYRLKPYLSRILPAVFETKQVSKKTKKAVIANGPFEKWGIDAMGPLPRTANGKLYILVAIDYMTRFGTPLEIVSDNGPGFRRGLLREVCEELKISHRHSTPYYPQSNGLVEKANGIIAGIIRKMMESRQEQSNDEAWIDRLLNLVELEWKREAAYHCYEKKALQLKDKLNEGIKDKEIKEKSLVLRYNNALDNRFDAKFERRWEGPFIVKKAFTGGYYQLMDLNGKEHPRKENGYRPKPYLSRILPAVFETKQVSKKTKKDPRCIFSALDYVKLQHGPFEHTSANRITIRLALKLAGKPYDLPASSNSSCITKRFADGCNEDPRCVFSALYCVKLQRKLSEHALASRITIWLALELAGKRYDLPTSFNASRVTIRLADGCLEGPRCVFSALYCVKLQCKLSEHPSASRITIRLALELGGKPYDLLVISNAKRLTIRLADGCSKDLRYVFSTLNCVKLQHRPSEHPSASCITIRLALELAGKTYDLLAISNARQLTIRLADGCSKGPHCVFSALNCVKLQRGSSEHPSARRITIRLALELAGKPFNASRLTIRLADGCSKGSRCGF